MLGEDPGLEAYVRDVVGRFRGDGRILFWDLYNEPGNSQMGEKRLPLAADTFRWARESGYGTYITKTVAWATYRFR